MAKGTAGGIPMNKAVGDTERPTADRQVNRLFSDLAQRNTWQLVINTGTTVIHF